MILFAGNAVEGFAVVIDGKISAAHLCHEQDHARNLHSALRKRNGNKGAVKRIRVHVEVIDAEKDEP